MCKNLKCYTIKDIDDYFKFITEHPIRIRDIFFGRFTLSEELRKMHDEKRKQFEKIKYKKLGRFLESELPSLVSSSDTLNFAGLHLYPEYKHLTGRVAEIKNSALIIDGSGGRYRATPELVDIALGGKNLSGINEPIGWFEDHVLYDRNGRCFYKSISHEAMIFWLTTQSVIDSINSRYEMNFYEIGMKIPYIGGFDD
jgi:hypothetical protein